MEIENGKMWHDGQILSYEDVRVPFLNPALHYGLAVFEGIRCYDSPEGPAVFRLHEHLQRFLDSIHIFGVLNMPYDLETLRKGTHEVVRVNNLRECYIRPLMYLARGSMGLNIDLMEPSVGIAAWPWATLLGEEGLNKGVRLMVSSFTRLHPNVIMTKAKVSGNYVNSVLAKTIASRAGFDETVMLDPEGYVAECSGENIFMVRDNVIYTPPRASILEGITRASIITLADDLGYAVVEDRISRDQLYIADEVFVCGTAAEVVPVREIDFRQIGKGIMGPVASALQSAFFKTVHGEGEHSKEWLDIVKV
ncbi:MAG: branched-chain amino acid transaminase [Anaerolineales bacterium]|nr:branched-chain amino acid transaminase [Anaerolineales bacterium]